MDEVKDLLIEYSDLLLNLGKSHLTEEEQQRIADIIEDRYRALLNI